MSCARISAHHPIVDVVPPGGALIPYDFTTLGAGSSARVIDTIAFLRASRSRRRKPWQKG